MSKTMPKTPQRKQDASLPRLIWVGPRVEWLTRFPKDAYVVCSRLQQIGDMARQATKDSLWVSSRPTMIDALVRVVAAQHRLETPIGKILMLNPPRAEVVPMLETVFSHVMGQSSSFKFLPLDQLSEVLSAPERKKRDLFIGGAVDMPSHTLVLVRGDCDNVVAPLSIFRPSGNAHPDFDRFELDDHGQTIRFGDYEASADFVLYEIDPAYRRRIHAERRKEEKGFGPSLRRLRILKKLRRDQFRGVSEKTIARIERGEVQKVHEQTLRVICHALNVEPDQVETY